MRRMFWLGVVLATAGLAGCSGETTIDHAKAEKFLSDNLNPKAQSVTCPDGIKAKTGTTFECKIVYADGVNATATVHVTSDNGDVETKPEDLHLPPG